MRPTSSSEFVLLAVFTDLADRRYLRRIATICRLCLDSGVDGLNRLRLTPKILDWWVDAS